MEPMEVLCYLSCIVGIFYCINVFIPDSESHVGHGSPTPTQVKLIDQLINETDNSNIDWEFMGNGIYKCIYNGVIYNIKAKWYGKQLTCPSTIHLELYQNKDKTTFGVDRDSCFYMKMKTLFEFVQAEEFFNKYGY